MAESTAEVSEPAPHRRAVVQTQRKTHSARLLNNVSAATAMRGLDGCVLPAVSEYVGEVEQAIETIAAQDFCRGCGVQARLHNRRPTWVRDRPAGGR